MDGGIDQAYLDFFGLDLQRAVLDAIARRPEGYLPVGASVVVATRHRRIPYLIVAPTMMVPEPVPPIHAYQAMAAALRIAGQLPQQIRHIFCPGLGTGIGSIPPTDAAHEMALAYRQWKERTTWGSGA